MESQAEKRQKYRRGNSATTQSLDSPGSSSQGGSKSVPNTSTGRPPTTTVLRSAMYYQNRIIVPEVKTRPYQPNAYSTGVNAGNSVNKLPSTQINVSNASCTPSISENSNSAINRTKQDSTLGRATSKPQFSDICDSSGHGAEMETRGIDIVVTDTEGNKQHKVKKKTIWRRIYLCLQDNRMEGNPNADLILAGSNPQEYRILKKVLNIIFLTIGTALLISVVIVVIYTAVADE